MCGGMHVCSFRQRSPRVCVQPHLCSLHFKEWQPLRLKRMSGSSLSLSLFYFPSIKKSIFFLSLFLFSNLLAGSCQLSLIMYLEGGGVLSVAPCKWKLITSTTKKQSSFFATCFWAHWRRRTQMFSCSAELHIVHSYLERFFGESRALAAVRPDVPNWLQRFGSDL